MRGILRVIPSEASLKSHRLLVLHRTPNPALLEDVVGGKLGFIPGFNTILDCDKEVRCLALGTREGSDQSQNSYAGSLWLQARLRKTGFSEAIPHYPDIIRGTVVVLYGDREFMATLAFTLMLRPDPEPEDLALASEAKTPPFPLDSRLQ